MHILETLWFSVVVVVPGEQLAGTWQEKVLLLLQEGVHFMWHSLKTLDIRAGGV